MENDIIRTENGYHIDQNNNNKWDSNIYSIEEAARSKTCEECKFYQKRQRFWCLVVAPNHKACEEFEPKEAKDE